MLAVIPALVSLQKHNSGIYWQLAGIYSQWLQGFRHPNDSIPPPVIADPVPYCEVLLVPVNLAILCRPHDGSTK